VAELPTGTVTFLFTDVEGSTELLQKLGPEEYGEALASHRRILREVFGTHGGVEVDTQGDAFFVAFPTAPGALQAAAEAQQRIAQAPILVRMGIHTGAAHVIEEGYVGADVHRAARIAACGHGGQVLVSASTAALVGAKPLRDLGEHRLKDLSAHERIYQLGDEEFPPLRSLHQTNLPVPATPFLGREGEVAELSALLGRDDVRLLTLTGPGGTGKTRLALQSAGVVADSYEGGVWWAPLAPLLDPALVLEVVAQSLGVTGDPAEHIGAKRLLLLLDNFEHVVVAAPEIGRLSRRCPRLVVLVTSREPLHLEGEWEYAVDPLRADEAVALFETRARAVRRDFATSDEVPQICAYLDNLPLAIELAAARVKVLSPHTLLERLERRLPLLVGGTRDAPERQRTLRATIEWSYELLDEGERRLLLRLAVFAGGWTLEAAERVCHADLDTLQSLVDKSLVRKSGERFEMLETIREYALERLDLSGDENEARLAHADYFIGRADALAPGIRGPAGMEAVGWLQAEIDNMLTALAWLIEAGYAEPALRLGATLEFFWMIRGGTTAGRLLLERAMERADAVDPLAFATALLALSRLVLNDGEVERAHSLAEQARRRSEELGDRALLLRSLLHLEWTSMLRGDLDRASRLCGESRELAVELGDRGAEGIVYAHLAFFARPSDLRHARCLYDEALQCFREVGNDAGVSGALNGLGWVDRLEGDLESADERAVEALNVARQMGHQAHIAASLELRGWVAAERADVDGADHAIGYFCDSLALNVDLGDKPETLDCIEAIGAIATDASVAVHLLAAAESIREDLGLSPPSESRVSVEAQVAACRATLSEQEFNVTWDAGRALSLGEALEFTRGLCLRLRNEAADPKGGQSRLLDPGHS
jgi:predicted ATPase/class 3 adenylate cyclase